MYRSSSSKSKEWTFIFLNNSVHDGLLNPRHVPLAIPVDHLDHFARTEVADAHRQPISNMPQMPRPQQNQIQDKKWAAQALRHSTWTTSRKKVASAVRVKRKEGSQPNAKQVKNKFICLRSGANGVCFKRLNCHPSKGQFNGDVEEGKDRQTSRRLCCVRGSGEEDRMGENG